MLSTKLFDKMDLELHLRRQRLDKPYVRENGVLKAASWDEALKRAARMLNVPGEQRRPNQ